MKAVSATRTRVVIMGAAGRDFHNFNIVFRDDPAYDVVAFTAAQIGGIAGRRYPARLAGCLYPRGIPVVPEEALEQCCAAHGVGQVVFAYSDISHAEVMHRASRALAAGADFVLLGPERTMLRASKPVIAVSAVRTGCGKSQTARWLSRRLRGHGLRATVMRHPMPYGDLERQAVQRFASLDDVAAAGCSVEEREEYEPHLAAGTVVHAGVDTARVLEQAQADGDLIVWDGGNNDFPFLRPDLHIVLLDALRPGHETTHHPGEAVVRMADVAVIAKSDAAPGAAAVRLADHVRSLNPRAAIVRGASPVTLDDAAAVSGRRVLVVEDGPTTTHGGMPYGAGFTAAIQAGGMVVDPRRFAAPEIASVYADYPHIGAVLPAMGYSAAQLAALAATINAAEVDVVVAATPVDLAALVPLNKRVVRARYEFRDVDEPGLGAVVDAFLRGKGLLRT